MKTPEAIEIIPFSDDLAAHFCRINSEWIEDMFVLEAHDRAVLENPQKNIIDEGGHIWFAKHRDLGVLGTCAVKCIEPGVFELTKMGVLAKARGLKIGEHLLHRVLDDCSKLPIETLFLLTSKKCEAAIHLYLKNGFAHDAEIMRRYGAIYARSNVAMRYSGPLGGRQ